MGMCQNIANVIILLVGARFARPKTTCLVYYSQGRDRWFGQVDPAPAADDWIGRFSFDILPMTDNTKLTASVIFAVFYR